MQSNLAPPRVSVRVGVGSGLATGKGWVGMWPVTRLDPSSASIPPYQTFRPGYGRSNENPILLENAGILPPWKYAFLPCCHVDFE